MKKIILILTLILVSTAASALPNYYIGLDLGSSNTHYSNGVLGSDNGTTGLGARFYGGYEFTPNFAFELGWAHYAKASGNRVKSIEQHAYDLSFVGRLPIGATGLSAFAKLGLAYMQAEKAFSGQGYAYANKIRPAYGLGVENVLTSNLSMTVQFWRVQGRNDAFGGFNVDSKLPNADLYTVGLIYRFV